jgi:hypothetical protein
MSPLKLLQMEVEGRLAIIVLPTARTILKKYMAWR